MQNEFRLCSDASHPYPRGRPFSSHTAKLMTDRCFGYLPVSLKKLPIPACGYLLPQRCFFYIQKTGLKV